jgi:hypothetical protein
MKAFQIIRKGLRRGRRKDDLYNDTDENVHHKTQGNRRFYFRRSFRVGPSNRQEGNVLADKKESTETKDLLALPNAMTRSPKLSHLINLSHGVGDELNIKRNSDGNTGDSPPEDSELGWKNASLLAAQNVKRECKENDKSMHSYNIGQHSFEESAVGACSLSRRGSNDSSEGYPSIELFEDPVSDIPKSMSSFDFA